MSSVELKICFCRCGQKRADPHSLFCRLVATALKSAMYVCIWHICHIASYPQFALFGRVLAFKTTGSPWPECLCSRQPNHLWCMKALWSVKESISFEHRRKSDTFVVMVNVPSLLAGRTLFVCIFLFWLSPILIFSLYLLFLSNSRVWCQNRCRQSPNSTTVDDCICPMLWQNQVTPVISHVMA